MAKLGEVCKVSPSTKNIERQGAWLLNLDMVEQQTGRVVEYNFVGEDGLNGSITQFDTENVLYSKLRPNLNKVVLPERNGFCTSELLPLRPDARKLDRSYLAVFLRSDGFVNWAVSKTAGAKMPRLGTKDLLNANIPLPEIKEQKAIAEKFEKLEELIFLRKQQIAKLDELVKARFVEMFGDFEVNPKEFPVYHLCELCDVGSSKRIYQEEQSISGIPFLKVADLNELIDTGKYLCSTFIPLERYEQLLHKELTPKENDILITSRGTLGKCYIVQSDDEFYFQDGMISWLSNLSPKVSSIYISYLFAQPYIQKQIESLQAGSTVAYLSIAMLKKMNVILPPKKLQDDFATFVEHVDQQKQTVQQSLEKLELMKKALMQEYFG